jgi:transposase
MQIDLANLPTDTALLHHLVRDIATTIEHSNSEIERLKSIIKQLQRAQFGRRSERLDPDQLALGLEDLDGDLAREEESRPQVERQQTERSSHRKPLPDHLPRADVRLDLDNMTCACCGETLHLIGESVSEMLDWIPAQLRVSPQICLPDLRDSGAGASSGAGDRRRPGNAGTACPGAGQQILRSHAALSAVADLCPPRR